MKDWNATMMAELVTVIQRFGQANLPSIYNMFDCHKLNELLPIEGELAVKAVAFAHLQPDERHAVRSGIDSKLAARLAAFSLRMATNAVGSRNESYLISGALVLTMDNDVLDPRDVYVVLAVLSDAGDRLSLRFDETLRSVANLATAQRQTVIVNGFVQGPSYMRNLKSMGVEFEEAQFGPKYRVRLS